MSYSDLSKEVIGDRAPETAFKECTTGNYYSVAKEAYSELKDYSKGNFKGFKDWADKVWREFEQPSHRLQMENKEARQGLYDKLAEASKKVQKYEVGSKEYAEALAKQEKLQAELDKVPSEAILNNLREGETDVELRITSYAGKQLTKFANTDFKADEHKFIANILGDEGSGLKTEFILGSTYDGTKVTSLRETVIAKGLNNIIEGKASTGSKLVDEYIAKFGAKAVTNLETVADTFRSLSKARNLPEYALLEKYMPAIRKEIEGGATPYDQRLFRIRELEEEVSAAKTKVKNLQGFIKENPLEGAEGKQKARIKNAQEKLPKLEHDVAVKEKELDTLHKTSPEEFKAKYGDYKPFYEKKREGNFKYDEELKVHDYVAAYVKATKKAIMSEYSANISKIWSNKHNGLSKAGMEATQQILETLNAKYVPGSGLDQALKLATRNFYRFSLYNNIGSVINNLTSIPNLLVSRYGAQHTMQAMANVNKHGLLKDLMDSVGIGSDRHSLATLLMMSTGDLDKVSKATKYDIFTKTENYMHRLAALASLSKRYGGLDKVEAQIAKIAKLPTATDRLKAYNKFLIPAKRGAEETMFKHLIGDDPKAYKSGGMSASIIRTMIVFTRQPTREAKFLWDAAKAAVSSKGRTMAVSEGREALAKYFFAKTMLMGRGAATFFIPSMFMQYMNAKLPEMRTAVEDFGDILDAVAIPKMVFGKLKLDFSQTQDIAWWWEIPYKLYTNPSKNSAILRFAEGMSTSIEKLHNGTADANDAFRIGAGALVFFPGGGTLNIGGLEVGGNQIRKILEAIHDLGKSKKRSYYGVDLDIRTPDDVHEVVARALFSSTPEKVEITKAKNTQDPESYRTYLLALAKKGKRDAYIFHKFTEGLGGDRLKAKKSLKASIARAIEDKQKRNNISGVVNGY